MMDGYCFYDITIHLNRQAETGLIHCEIKLLAEIIGVLREDFFFTNIYIFFFNKYVRIRILRQVCKTREKTVAVISLR